MKTSLVCKTFSLKNLRMAFLIFVISSSCLWDHRYPWMSAFCTEGSHPRSQHLLSPFLVPAMWGSPCKLHCHSLTHEVHLERELKGKRTWGCGRQYEFNSIYVEVSWLALGKPSLEKNSILRKSFIKRWPSPPGRGFMKLYFFSPDSPDSLRKK